YWLEVGEEEQAKRINKRITDPRKTWKLGTLDLKNVALWWDYAKARDEMLRRTSSEWAPWHVVHTDDKEQGRLNLITHLLSQIPYEAPEQRKITLPARNEKPEGYEELDLTPYEVPTPF
ncbi:MAG: polyphosphate kinase 2, partial [Acidimicrobiales bacterium]